MKTGVKNKVIKHLDTKREELLEALRDEYGNEKYEVVKLLHLRLDENMSFLSRKQFEGYISMSVNEHNMYMNIYVKPHYIKEFSSICSRGGITVCVLHNITTGKNHIGVSVCSINDSFDKKEGRLRAINRSLEARLLDKKIVIPAMNNDAMSKVIIHSSIGNIDHVYVLE